jgi:hypothetical protein
VELADFDNQFTDVRETQQQLLAHTHTQFTERRALQDRDQLRHQNANLAQEAKAMTGVKARFTKISQTMDDLNLKMKRKRTMRGSTTVHEGEDSETKRTDVKMEVGDKNEEMVTSRTAAPKH